MKPRAADIFFSSVVGEDLTVKELLEYKGTMW